MAKIDSQKKALSALGKMVIENMKDKQIELFDSLCAGAKDNPSDNGIQMALSEVPKEYLDLMRDMIIQATIGGAFDFLCELEEVHRCENRAKLLIDNINVFEAGGDGIASELFSEQGWDARYSKFPTQESITEKYMRKYGVDFPAAEFDDEGNIIL